MWYTTSMKQKIFFSVVIVMLCMTTIIFGAGGSAGAGGNGEAKGTLTVTDANRFVVFTSKAQLDEYCASHVGDLFTLPAEQRAVYDDEFFKSQALVMFLTDGMSGSIKVSCEGYEMKGGELHATVKEMSPPMHTMDLRYNTLTVAVPQEIATNITKVVLNSYRVQL